jgi:TPR repeat protein
MADTVDDPEVMITEAKQCLAARDTEGAAQWLERAAAAGHADAMRLRGNLAFGTGDHDAAYDWWDRAGQAGQPLGWRHAAVQSVRSRRLDDSIGWWEKLAATGDADAPYQLGIIALGRGQVAAGQDWLDQAAARGSVDAMFTLGDRASQAGDADAARAWRVRAMAAGSDAAMAALVAERPKRRTARDLQAVRDAVDSGELEAVYRVAGGWTKAQQGELAALLEAAGPREVVLLLHAVLATPQALGKEAAPFLAAAAAIEPGDDDHPARWARALGRAHAAGAPYLVADHL